MQTEPHQSSLNALTTLSRARSEFFFSHTLDNSFIIEEFYFISVIGGAENGGPENAGPENTGPNVTT